VPGADLGRPRAGRGAALFSGLRPGTWGKRGRGRGRPRGPATGSGNQWGRAGGSGWVARLLEQPLNVFGVQARTDPDR